MANAAAKGRVIGRPLTKIEELPNKFLKHYPKYRDRQINITEFSRLCGLSRQTIYKYLRIYSDTN